MKVPVGPTAVAWGHAVSPLLRHGWIFHGRPDGRVDLCTLVLRVVKSRDTGGFNGVSICSSTNIRTSLVVQLQESTPSFRKPQGRALSCWSSTIGIQNPQTVEPHPRHRSRWTLVISEAFSIFGGLDVWEEHFFEGAIHGQIQFFLWPRPRFWIKLLKYSISRTPSWVRWSPVIFQLISLDLMWTSESYPVN